MKKQTSFEHTVPAVEKAVLILETLARSGTGMTHSALAAECGVTPSTCYRILCTLMLSGWLEKRKDGTFHLSGGLLPLSLRVCSRAGENWDHVQQILDELAGRTLLACKLSVRKHDLQQVVARAESPGPFSISGKTGAEFPLPEGSVGAALLADSTQEERSELLERITVDIPEKSDPALLEESVSVLQSRGYVLNTTRNRWRIAALSVPLRNFAGNIVAALTLLGLPENFTQKDIPRYLSALEQAQKAFVCNKS